MTVYVDALRPTIPTKNWPYKWSAHLMADTEAQLLVMAQLLGLREAWYQGDHFDITSGKYRQALALGAERVRMRDLVVLRRKKRRAKEALEFDV